MKAILNVKGTKLSVLSIHYSQNGEPTSVNTRDEKGRLDATYADKSLEGNAADIYDGFLDLKVALEYPELEARIVEDNKRLIQFLEEDLIDKKRKLHNILIEMGALKDDAPFSNLAAKLLEKHSEHALMEQRVFGIIDTIEKLKAFMEGYYANVDDETVTA